MCLGCDRVVSKFTTEYGDTSSNINNVDYCSVILLFKKDKREEQSGY